jgi:hypothetical protein
VIFMGIDPGASGGWAIVTDDGCLIRCGKLAEFHKLVRELSGPKYDCIVLEDVHSTPQMGVKSAYTFGYNVGIVRGHLDALKQSYRLVPPQTWQREYGLIIKGRKMLEKNGKRKSDDKKKLTKAKAIAMYPHEKSRITHATADAILLAEYARRLWMKEAGR